MRVVHNPPVKPWKYSHTHVLSLCFVYCLWLDFAICWSKINQSHQTNDEHQWHNKQTNNKTRTENTKKQWLIFWGKQFWDRASFLNTPSKKSGKLQNKKMTSDNQRIKAKRDTMTNTLWGLSYILICSEPPLKRLPQYWTVLDHSLVPLPMDRCSTSTGWSGFALLREPLDIHLPRWTVW